VSGEDKGGKYDYILKPIDLNYIKKPVRKSENTFYLYLFLALFL